MEESIHDSEIRKKVLKRLEKVIDRPGPLVGFGSVIQCLSEVPKILLGCLTESEMVNYLKARADYLVKQVACNAIDTAQGILRSTRRISESEAHRLAAALLTADCEPVKTARGKLSNEEKWTLEGLVKEKPAD